MILFSKEHNEDPLKKSMLTSLYNENLEKKELKVEA